LVVGEAGLAQAYLCEVRGEGEAVLLRPARLGDPGAAGAKRVQDALEPLGA